MRVEIKNESGEVTDIFETDNPSIALATFQQIVADRFGYKNVGTWGKGWNHTPTGYARTDNKGHIVRMSYGEFNHRWDVYVLSKLVCHSVVTRRDAVNICDNYIKNMETTNG